MSFQDWIPTAFNSQVVVLVAAAIPIFIAFFSTTATTTKKKSRGESITINHLLVNEFDDDILTDVFRFVGEHNSLFVGSVDRRFRDLYEFTYPTMTTTPWEAGVETLSCARMMM